MIGEVLKFLRVDLTAEEVLFLKELLSDERVREIALKFGTPYLKTLDDLRLLLINA